MEAESRAREAFKRNQYRLADERNEEAGLGGACVLCHVGVPGGSHIGSEHHEIISKADLPGRRNRETLFSLENIASSCPVHHAQLGHIRLLWLKTMVVTGLARPERYQREPFSSYWEEADYPPALTCFGQYGTGTRHYQSGASLPESLRRLYKSANPGFDEIRFCEFCGKRVACDKLTASRKEQAQSAIEVNPTEADMARSTTSCGK